MLVTLEIPPDQRCQHQCQQRDQAERLEVPRRRMERIRDAQAEERREKRRDEQRQHRAIGAVERAGEAESQAAPARVGEAELHRGAQQRRKHDREDHHRHHRGAFREASCQRIAHDQHTDEDVAAQHLERIAVEIERVAVDQRVAVEVAQPTHLGPRVVQAQRDDGQQQVDDPDPEIFAARARETNFERALEGLRRRGGRRPRVLRECVHPVPRPVGAPPSCCGRNFPRARELCHDPREWVAPGAKIGESAACIGAAGVPTSCGGRRDAALRQASTGRY